MAHIRSSTMQDPNENAVQFHEAWRHVMSNASSRAWVFDSTTPSALHLIQGRFNSSAPFIISTLIQTDSTQERVFSHEQYQNRLDELYCCIATLEDGTRLGVVLNSMGMDIWASVFSGLSNQFTNPAVTVIRLVLTSTRGCLFMFQLAWFVSGALSVRFRPLPQFDFPLNFQVVAFGKTEAQLLNTIALCDEPSRDFLNAKFDELFLVQPCLNNEGISRGGRFILNFQDIRRQETCIFCAAQAFPQCVCPIPMRRRRTFHEPGFDFSTASARVPVSTIDKHTALWDMLASLLKAQRGHRTAMCNVHLTRNTETQDVLACGFLSFDTCYYWNVSGTDCFNQFLASTRMTMCESTRTIMSQNSITARPKNPSMIVNRNNAGKAVGTLQALTRTRPSAQPKTRTKYECPICGILISNKKSNLTRHIQNSHGNVRRFACREQGCQSRFKTSAHLKRHLFTIHSKIVDGKQLAEYTRAGVSESRRDL